VRTDRHAAEKKKYKNKNIKNIWKRKEEKKKYKII
jgi:hypothetical protein